MGGESAVVQDLITKKQQKRQGDASAAYLDRLLEQTEVLPVALYLLAGVWQLGKKALAAIFAIWPLLVRSL